MNFIRPLFALGLFAAVAGCSKNESPAPTAASASAAAEAVVAVAVEKIPVKEDFEDAAKSAVTAANLDDQLDQLEKQIGQ